MEDKERIKKLNYEIGALKRWNAEYKYVISDKKLQLRTLKRRLRKVMKYMKVIESILGLNKGK